MSWIKISYVAQNFIKEIVSPSFKKKAVSDDVISLLFFCTKHYY